MKFPCTLPILPATNLPATDHSLPELQNCPITTGIVNSVVDMTQAPTEMVLVVAISAYSTVTQGFMDVERPEVGRGPASLYTCTVADSGERKSATERIFAKPITDFEEAENRQYISKLAEYEVEREVHDMEVSGVRKDISKKIKAGEDVDDQKERLITLKLSAPTKPRKLQLMIEDSTPQSIAFDLAHGGGNVALVSPEGSSIINGRAFHDLSILNKMWSAEPVTVNRKSSDSFVVNDARLTISIMVQPAAISKFMKKKGDESVGTGFWARTIFCRPCSTQGARYIGGKNSSSDDMYHCYVEKANEALKKTKEINEGSNLHRKAIGFSDEAKRRWVDTSNRIEAHLNPGGRYEHAKDHASKLADNTARIAAQLSYFEQGDESQITLGILMDAERIAFYFSDQFLRCFKVLPEYIKDSKALGEYLQSLREDGDRYVRKNRILQSGPSRLRNKPALDQALSNLTQEGVVEVNTCGRGMIVVDLYPGFFFDNNEWNLFCFKNKINQYSVV